jgi:hypothetical protein
MIILATTFIPETISPCRRKGEERDSSTSSFFLNISNYGISKH